MSQTVLIFIINYLTIFNHFVYSTDNFHSQEKLHECSKTLDVAFIVENPHMKLNEIKLALKKSIETMWSDNARFALYLYGCQQNEAFLVFDIEAKKRNYDYVVNEIDKTACRGFNRNMRYLNQALYLAYVDGVRRKRIIFILDYSGISNKMDEAKYLMRSSSLFIITQHAYSKYHFNQMTNIDEFVFVANNSREVTKYVNQMSLALCDSIQTRNPRQCETKDPMEITFVVHNNTRQLIYFNVMIKNTIKNLIHNFWGNQIRFSMIVFGENFPSCILFNFNTFTDDEEELFHAIDKNECKNGGGRIHGTLTSALKEVNEKIYPMTMLREEGVPYFVFVMDYDGDPYENILASTDARVLSLTTAWRRRYNKRKLAEKEKYLIVPNALGFYDAMSQELCQYVATRTKPTTLVTTTTTATTSATTTNEPETTPTPTTTTATATTTIRQKTTIQPMMPVNIIVENDHVSPKTQQKSTSSSLMELTGQGWIPFFMLLLVLGLLMGLKWRKKYRDRYLTEDVFMLPMLELSNFNQRDSLPPASVYDDINPNEEKGFQFLRENLTMNSVHKSQFAYHFDLLSKHCGFAYLIHWLREQAEQNEIVSSFSQGTKITLHNYPNLVSVDANWIVSPSITPWCFGINWIAAQSPNGHNLLSFLSLIWQCRVNFIVMLSGNMEHFHQYWPYQVGKSFVIGFFNITLVSQQNKNGIMIRRLDIKNMMKSNKSRRVYHLQCLDWNDRLLPTMISFDCLHQKLSKSIMKMTSRMEKSVLVHCPDGLGRTGTFLTTIKLLEELKNEYQQAIDITRIILTIRESRQNMISNAKQMELIYRFVLHNLPSSSQGVRICNQENHYTLL